MKLVVQKSYNLRDDEKLKFENLGYEISFYNDEEIEGDVFVGMLLFDEAPLTNVKGLKFVQSTIAGFDNLDLNAIKDQGITFSSANGVNSIPIAEYVVLKVLDHYKDAQRFRDQQDNREWKSRNAHDMTGIYELTNKRVMVLGTGNIGTEITKRLKPFGVTLVGINSDGRAVSGFDETYALDDVYDHLGDVDVVVGALPLNKHTKGLYNSKFFNSMKDDAVFMNVGRGPQTIVDDVLEAASHKLAHVYLDVTPVEPLESSSALWTHPKISITPHISASSDYVTERVKELVYKNLKSYMEDRPLINKVV